MKIKKLVFLGLLTLFAAPIVLGGDQKKEIRVEEAMKYYCQTWINPAYYENESFPGIRIMKKDANANIITIKMQNFLCIAAHL
jgi:hypothetical protein